MQNIPSHNKEIRMLFKAKTEELEIEPEDNIYSLQEWEEVETENGFKYAKDLTEIDKLRVDGSTIISIKKVENINTNVLIYI